MSAILRFRAARALGRALTTAAALLTLGRMPPFVSSAAVVVEGDRILAVLDVVRGEPVLPGGHLRWRESPRAGVVREVAEETGLRIEPHRLVDVVSGEQLAGELGVVRVIFEASVTGGALRSSEEGEASWLPIDRFLSEAARDGPILRSWLAVLEREALAAE